MIWNGGRFFFPSFFYVKNFLEWLARLDFPLS